MRKLLAPLFAAMLLAGAPQIQAAERPSGGEPARPSQGNQQKAPQQNQQKPAPAQQSSAKGQYGQWKSAWGKTPPAPPKHWTKKSDWYRHVRACQQRYKSYNAKTDTYRANSGKVLRCKL